MDVSSLFAKLVAAGIIPKGEKKDEPAQEDKKQPEAGPSAPQVRPLETAKSQVRQKKREAPEKIPDLSLGKTDQFKTFYKGVIQGIYEGIQCSSCGTRFKMEDTNIYREHLDWHFRQNKRGKDDMKVARNRNWFYKITDWIQFEEFGDAEDREHSQIFDSMLHQDPRNPDAAPAAPVLAAAAAVAGKGVSCPVATGNEQDDVCCICHDPFEQYWNEEAEDWHLRDAIRIDNKTYHPVCYEDAREEGTILEPSPTPTKAVKTNPLDEQIQQASLSSERSSTPPSLSDPTPVPVTVPVTGESAVEAPKDTNVPVATIKQEPVEETAVKEKEPEPTMTVKEEKTT